LGAEKYNGKLLFFKYIKSNAPRNLTLFRYKDLPAD